MTVTDSRPRWFDHPAAVIPTWVASAFSRAYRGTPVIYVMACMSRDGTWEAIYIGQTTDGFKRLLNHPKYDEAMAYGFTHLHVIEVKEKWELKLLERLMIEWHQPRLNKHHNIGRDWAKRYPGPLIADEFLRDPLKLILNAKT